MFGRKKMYKKGLEDAMRAYEAFGRKQEAALAKIREEVRQGNVKMEEALLKLGDDLNGIYDYLTSKEKAALYHLSTPMDIKELDDQDKHLLMAVLYQLAEDEGISAITDEQRNYIRAVQRYLEVTNPDTHADLDVVADIDSLEVQKTFYQVTLEFFYLQDGDELTDEQEAFQNNFSINKKQSDLIDLRVSRLYNAMGAQGLAEKYGYVPEEESTCSSVHSDWCNVPDSTVHKMLEIAGTTSLIVIETENYLFFVREYKAKNNLIELNYIEKSSGKASSAMIEWTDSWPYPENFMAFSGVPDTIIVRIPGSGPYLLKSLSMQTGEIENINLILESNSKVSACRNNCVCLSEWVDADNSMDMFLYNIDTDNLIKNVPLPFGADRYCGAAMTDNALLLLAMPKRFGKDAEAVINILDYKNDCKPITEWHIQIHGLENVFAEWRYIPGQMIVHENGVILAACADDFAIFQLRFDKSGNFQNKYSITEVRKTDFRIEIGPNWLPVVHNQKLLCIFDTQPIIPYSNFTDPNYGICAIDLEAEDQTVSEGKGITVLVNKGISSIKWLIGDYLYFIDKKGVLRRLNIENPGLVESAP